MPKKIENNQQKPNEFFGTLSKKENNYCDINSEDKKLFDHIFWISIALNSLYESKLMDNTMMKHRIMMMKDLFG